MARKTLAKKTKVLNLLSKGCSSIMDYFEK